MGGFGSGNYYRRSTKSTVEGSLVLAAGYFYRRRLARCSGTLTWTWTNGDKSSVGYIADWGFGVPTITLHYRWRDCEDVRIPIRLQFTPTNFDGERCWFTCPLIVDGVACNRRAGKLYLPPGARYFGCRKCHRLTYRSCQEAHRTERLFGRLGMPYDRELERMLFRR